MVLPLDKPFGRPKTRLTGRWCSGRCIGARRLLAVETNRLHIVVRDEGNVNTAVPGTIALSESGNTSPHVHNMPREALSRTAIAGIPGVTNKPSAREADPEPVSVAAAGTGDATCRRRGASDNGSPRQSEWRRQSLPPAPVVIPQRNYLRVCARVVDEPQFDVPVSTFAWFTPDGSTITPNIAPRSVTMIVDVRIVNKGAKTGVCKFGRGGAEFSPLSTSDCFGPLAASTFRRPTLIRPSSQVSQREESAVGGIHFIGGSTADGDLFPVVVGDFQQARQKVELARERRPIRNWRCCEDRPTGNLTFW